MKPWDYAKTLFRSEKLHISYPKAEIGTKNNRFWIFLKIMYVYAPCMYAKLFTLLDLCVSSLRRGHANLLCIVPILTDDPRRESKISMENRSSNSRLSIPLGMWAHGGQGPRQAKNAQGFEKKSQQHPKGFPGGPPPRY